MHFHLMEKHHLRHYGRLQYGLFLKGIGVRPEDAKNYFKREYSKIETKKLNEYMYLIEHMYGLKGKKTDYTPWGCSKMINQNAPGTIDLNRLRRLSRLSFRVFRRKRHQVIAAEEPHSAQRHRRHHIDVEEPCQRQDQEPGGSRHSPRMPAGRCSR